MIMRIRNKYTKAEYFSDSLLKQLSIFIDTKQETYVYKFYKSDGWEEVIEEHPIPDFECNMGDKKEI